MSPPTLAIMEDPGVVTLHRQVRMGAGSVLRSNEGRVRHRHCGRRSLAVNMEVHLSEVDCIVVVIFRLCGAPPATKLRA